MLSDASWCVNEEVSDGKGLPQTGECMLDWVIKSRHELNPLATVILHRLRDGFVNLF